VKLMELKDKTTLSREEAAARLHAIADELASGNDVVIERETMRFVAHVPRSGQPESGIRNRGRWDRA
jgi:hypothetical protein